MPCHLEAQQADTLDKPHHSHPALVTGCRNFQSRLLEDIMPINLVLEPSAACLCISLFQYLTDRTPLHHPSSSDQDLLDHVLRPSVHRTTTTTQTSIRTRPSRPTPTIITGIHPTGFSLVSFDLRVQRRHLFLQLLFHNIHES